MKIVHLCLYGPVMDGWNYQDNLLTKYHKKMGNDVTIIASKWIWGKNNKLEYFDRTNYYNEDGVKVIRLDIKKGKTVLSKFKRYSNIIKTIDNEKPDILFIHNAAYLDILKVVRYIKNNKSIRVFVDNHNDFSNTARNIISKYILHMGIWRIHYKLLEPYVEKFYGVLPARVDFLRDVYGINRKKTELLVMGVDDEQANKWSDVHFKKSFRRKYNIYENDFLIVTGGKIDAFKTQTLLLMEAIKNIDRDNVKLIVFGSVDECLKDKVKKLCYKNKIQYIGWIDSLDSYKYFSIADLVVFPGRHSVFWEQVAGQGIPMVCRYWSGTTHIDVGGNVKFLKEDKVDIIQKKIEEIINDKILYRNMKNIAKNKAMGKFSYKEISKVSIMEE